MGVAKLEDAGVIQQPVTQYVSSGKDFVVIKKWVASMIGDPEDTRITVSAEPDEVDPLTMYESMQPYKSGVIISYADPMMIEAQGPGLVALEALPGNLAKRLPCCMMMGMK